MMSFRKVRIRDVNATLTGKLLDVFSDIHIAPHLPHLHFESLGINWCVGGGQKANIQIKRSPYRIVFVWGQYEDLRTIVRLMCVRRRRVQTGDQTACDGESA